MCKWGEETIPILTSTPSILFLIQDRIQSPTALRKFFAPNYGSSPYLVGQLALLSNSKIILLTSPS